MIKKEEMLRIIKYLEKIVGKEIPIKTLKQETKNNKITSQEFNKVILNLKQNGYIYQPKKGYLARV